MNPVIEIISRVSPCVTVELLNIILCICLDLFVLHYLVVLLNMSTAERSSHAVELEKRAIQLTVEEGKKIVAVLTFSAFSSLELYL